MLRLARASGKQCPRCGSWGKEAQRTKRGRVYECPRCGLTWDRDKGVLYNLACNYFRNLLGEECDDCTVLATRIIEAMREWLEEHPKILAC